MAKYAKMAVEVIDLDKVEMPEVKKEEPKKKVIMGSATCPKCNFIMKSKGVLGEYIFIHCYSCDAPIAVILQS
jgi:ssDNA-binding Zn-finger/Zn-ribbon topoisomerase 1